MPSIIWLLLVPITLAVAQPQPQRAPGNDSISKDQLKADLYFLAGDGLRGRLTGTRECGDAFCQRPGITVESQESGDRLCRHLARKAAWTSRRTSAFKMEDTGPTTRPLPPATNSTLSNSLARR